MPGQARSRHGRQDRRKKIRASTLDSPSQVKRQGRQSASKREKRRKKKGHNAEGNRCHLPNHNPSTFFKPPSPVSRPPFSRSRSSRTFTGTCSIFFFFFSPPSLLPLPLSSILLLPLSSPDFLSTSPVVYSAPLLSPFDYILLRSSHLVRPKLQPLRRRKSTTFAPTRDEFAARIQSPLFRNTILYNSSLKYFIFETSSICGCLSCIACRTTSKK